MAAIYRMGADGKLHAPGLPDIVPSGGITPPPPPPPVGLLQFGTPAFGQSYARYKGPTSYTQQQRYNSVEFDTKHTLDGVVRHGSCVMRDYADTIGTWSGATSNLRAGQPIIWSFKAGSEGEATFKANVRTFLDSKDPATTAFMWLAFWHEPDDDIYSAGTMTLDYWITRNLWVREVIDEVDYADRTDFRFGPIFTGSPWNKGTAPSNPRSWLSFYNAMVAARGDTDTWDYMGADRYNPAWDGPNNYVAVADWMTRLDDMHEQLGLPAIVGEGGSARVFGNYTGGKTYAQLDLDRANYMDGLLTAVRDRGYFDAFSWWRVPAIKANGYGTTFNNPFSTIMITPTGYNSAADAAAGNGPPGGTDAQVVVDVWSKFCIEALDATGIPYYTGGAP